MGTVFCDKCGKMFEDSKFHRGSTGESKLKKHEFWCKGKIITRDIIIEMDDSPKN